jgi:DNA-binding transcriptional ArsR family regulator
MAGYNARLVFNLIAATPRGLLIDQMVAQLKLDRRSVSRALKSLRSLKLVRAIEIRRHRVYRYVARPGAVCPSDRRGGPRPRWYSSARSLNVPQRPGIAAS